MSEVVDVSRIDQIINERLEALLPKKLEDFIPEVKDYCGAATFLPIAKDADVSLFI